MQYPRLVTLIWAPEMGCTSSSTLSPLRGPRSHPLSWGVPPTLLRLRGPERTGRQAAGRWQETERQAVSSGQGGVWHPLQGRGEVRTGSALAPPQGGRWHPT